MDFGNFKNNLCCEPHGNLINCTNEPFHRKENHGEQTCGCQGGGGGSGMDWEFGLIDANYCFWNG